MRRDLIKIVLLFLFLQLQLFASTYEWSVYSDKTTAYTNEAIYLKYSCSFSDRGELYVIDFNPTLKNENATVTLLSETTKFINSKRVNVYEFVAFVHKEGVHKFEFEMVMKKTNQDSIENTVMGRDNGEYEEFTKRYLRQEAVVVDVKKSASSTVGELRVKIDAATKELKAYEPYHLEITLDGIANFGDIAPLAFDVEGVKIFSSAPTQNIKLTKEGYVGSWSQKFAFVGAKDFVVPSFTFSYFDLKTESVKARVFEAQKVSVEEAYSKEELLDEDESFSFDYSYLYCVLSFIAGFLVSKVRFKKEAKVSSKEKEFLNKIQKAKTMDEILFALILKDAKGYGDVIAKIESKEITTLGEVKKLIND